MFNMKCITRAFIFIYLLYQTSADNYTLNELQGKWIWQNSSMPVHDSCPFLSIKVHNTTANVTYISLNRTSDIVVTQTNKTDVFNATYPDNTTVHVIIVQADAKDYLIVHISPEPEIAPLSAPFGAYILTRSYNVSSATQKAIWNVVNSTYSNVSFYPANQNSEMCKPFIPSFTTTTTTRKPTTPKRNAASHIYSSTTLFFLALLAIGL